MKDGYLRGAAAAAPRTGPLRIVTAAVAGDDLQSVARSAADALGCSVAIALPQFGPTVTWPPNASPPDVLRAVGEYATALLDDADAQPPAGLAHSVPVRIGRDVVGVVVATGGNGRDPALWLEAAAAAAAVTALIGDSSGFDAESARRAFLQMLELQAPGDIDALLAHARRFGCELSAGALGLCAASSDGPGLDRSLVDALIADMGDGRLLGLLPLDGEAAGMPQPPGDHPVALSAPRTEPTGLHEALREAAVLFELVVDPRAHLAAHEETYRLLVGVLLSNPSELERLRSSTVAEVEQYDELHDTELLATLEAFLAHHGSTTETADAMSLHRHTVGYRLARVQEVSGLSPYESDGRERLSLGLKAHRILLAEQRRSERRRRG
jgi:hypothetical protein